MNHAFSTLAGMTHTNIVAGSLHIKGDSDYCPVISCANRMPCLLHNEHAIYMAACATRFNKSQRQAIASLSIVPDALQSLIIGYIGFYELNAEQLAYYLGGSCILLMTEVGKPDLKMILAPAIGSDHAYNMRIQLIIPRLGMLGRASPRVYSMEFFQVTAEGVWEWISGQTEQPRSVSGEVELPVQNVKRSNQPRNPYFNKTPEERQEIRKRYILQIIGTALGMIRTAVGWRNMSSRPLVSDIAHTPRGQQQ